MKIKFNRNPLTLGNTIEQPTDDLIKNSLGLFRASMDDAIKFGGELTRFALQNVTLTNSRKYVLVDVKVHMLMPGFYPAIPGWHTDGVPRPNKDKPDLRLQEGKRDNLYHLLVTGKGCLTEFFDPTITLNIPDEPTPDLYKIINEQVEKIVNIEPSFKQSMPSCQFLSWDWWSLHRGVAAKRHEWRYLIRVTETDFIEPLTDLRDVLRTQHQVYVPLDFGW